MRLKPAHIMRKVSICFDIGRVGNDEVKAPQIVGPSRLCPVTMVNAGTIIQPEPGGIGSGQSHGAKRGVHANAGGLWPLAEQSQQQRTEALEAFKAGTVRVKDINPGPL